MENKLYDGHFDGNYVRQKTSRNGHFDRLVKNTDGKILTD